jgi:hypothetical protein
MGKMKNGVTSGISSGKKEGGTPCSVSDEIIP